MTRLVLLLAAASAVAGCSPVVDETQLGQARSAATCQRNCPEPDEPPPEEVPAYSVRLARRTGQSAGLHLYRRANSTPNYIEVHTQAQGRVATLVVEASQPGDASTTRRYTLHAGGRKLTLERQPNVVRLIAERHMAAERSVTYHLVPRDRRFRHASGDSALPQQVQPQLALLAAVVEDIGEADLQSITDRSGPAPMLDTPQGTGCYDRAGFCSAEYRGCIPCPGSGGADSSGNGPGTGGGGPGGPTCNGDETVGIGISLLGPLGQFRARQDVDADCNKYNQGCSDGCCAFLQTDGKWGPTPEVTCECVIGNLICTCYLFGKSCGESPLPENPMDEVEYP